MTARRPAPPTAANTTASNLPDSPPSQPTNAEAETALRRTPTQRRSRERVERMLEAAMALIENEGSDTMRMSDVAERAGVSIGSLYQYFPDKAAIVRTLAERYNAASRTCIEAGLAPVRTGADLAPAFTALVDEYYAIFLAEPVMRDIWSATQADKALRELEIAESRLNAALLADTLARLNPGAPRPELEATALLLMHLGESAMRLAVSVERAEGDRLVESYKRMALAALREAAGG